MDILENGHGGGGTDSVSSGMETVGSGGWRSLYIKASGVTNESGSYDGRYGYSQSIPNMLRAVWIVSQTWSMTLRITGTGCRGTAFSAGPTAGTGGCGNLSQYRFGNRVARHGRTSPPSEEFGHSKGSVELVGHGLMAVDTVCGRNRVGMA